MASSYDGSKLVAATNGGYIYTSADSGATWTQTGSQQPWTSVASSSDGTKLVAVTAGPGGNQSQGNLHVGGLGSYLDTDRLAAELGLGGIFVRWLEAGCRCQSRGGNLHIGRFGNDLGADRPAAELGLGGIFVRWLEVGRRRQRRIRLRVEGFRNHVGANCLSAARRKRVLPVYGGILLGWHEARCRLR